MVQLHLDSLLQLHQVLLVGPLVESQVFPLLHPPDQVARDRRVQLEGLVHMLVGLLYRGLLLVVFGGVVLVGLVVVGYGLG